MILRRALLAIPAIVPLVACAGVPQPSSRDDALAEIRAPDPIPHADAKFRVSYGGEDYLVDVRYVELIDESVIAVRQAGRKAAGRDYRPLGVAPRVRAPVGPFSNPAYRAVALDIAETVQWVDGICPSGDPMDMARDGEGDIRTLYRRNRGAWVVFARCVEKSAG